MRLGQKGAAVPVESIPTGSIAFDLSLASEGSREPRRRDLRPEATGKTTLALHVIAEAQKRAARRPSSTPSTPWTPSMPPGWASTSTTSSSPSPTTASRPWRSPRSRPERSRRRRRCGFGRGPRPKRSSRRDGRRHMASRRGSCPKPCASSRPSSPLQDVLHLHQPAPGEDRHVHRQPGDDDRGRALKFYSSMRIDVRRLATLKKARASSATGQGQDRQEQDGPALPRVPVRHHLREGISREGDLVDCGLDYGILERTGPGTPTGASASAGRDNVKRLLKENKELAARLEAEIRAKVGSARPRQKPSPRENRSEGRIQAETKPRSR